MGWFSFLHLFSLCLQRLSRHVWSWSERNRRPGREQRKQRRPNKSRNVPWPQQKAPRSLRSREEMRTRVWKVNLILLLFLHSLCVFLLFLSRSCCMSFSFLSFALFSNLSIKQIASVCVWREYLADGQSDWPKISDVACSWQEVVHPRFSRF